MGTTWKRFVSVVLTSVLLAQGAVAGSDDLRPFEAPDLDAAALRALLTEKAADLSTDGDVASKSGTVVVCARGTADERTAVAKDLADQIAKGREAMKAVGWSVPAKAPSLTFIRVRVTGAAPLRVFSDDGTAVVVREGDSARKVEPPTPPTRPDGPALVRDVVLAGNRARVWAQSVAEPPQRPAVPEVAAARTVAALVPKGSAPAWLTDGLTRWVESKITGRPCVSTSHVCKSWVTPTPATLETLAAARGGAPVSGSAFLGRFVGVLLEGRADGGTKFFELARATGTLDAALQANFGKSLAQVIAAAAPAPAGDVPSAAPAAPPAFTCDDAGTILCPACAGNGRFDVACTECAGTTATSCPACSGITECQNCVRGWVRFEGGDKKRCKVCAGGKTRCMACSGSLKAPCKSCKGLGKVGRACIACASGRMPCPAASAPADRPPCRWCAGPKQPVACDGCDGAGFLGCGQCSGTLRWVCDGCEGTGEVQMVYEDGTTASASKCKGCDGKGFVKCDECKNGKLPCAPCSGAGRKDPDPKDCTACGGESTLPAPDASLLRPRSEPLTKDEADAQQAMLDRAIDSLLTCRRQTNGPFSLRKLRRGATDVAMQLEESTPFANAMALWTLAVAGRGKDDPELSGAWKALREDAATLVAGTDGYVGAQAASLTLRALVMGGEDVKGPLIKGLIDRILKGQHADGLWGGDLLDLKEETDLLDSLFVVEGLRTARLKGAKIPGAVWNKTLRGATAHLEGRTLSGKTEWLTGTTVASAVALVVMAKEGSLGSRATAFDYREMPPVKRGIAWLDRHFDIIQEPCFASGVKSPRSSDAGYMAWLFSIQRLGMLLSTDELGGERWYARGVRHLKSVQYRDGSFEERSPTALNGALRTTSGAILFLLRATPPITNSSDDE